MMPVSLVSKVSDLLSPLLNLNRLFITTRALANVIERCEGQNLKSRNGKSLTSLIMLTGRSSNG